MTKQNKPDFYLASSEGYGMEMPRNAFGLGDYVRRLSSRPWLFLMVAVALIVSCSLSPWRQGDVPIAMLDFPRAEYDYVTISEGEVIVWASSVSLGSESARNIWLYARLGDNDLKQVLFPLDSNCSLDTQYFIGDFLPDGRLQVRKECVRGPIEESLLTLTYLMAYDIKSGTLDQTAGPLPLGSISATWNSEGTRAVVYLSDAFSSKTLYWLQQHGNEPMDLTISGGGKSWNLKNLFPDFPDDQIAKSGNAGRADWSPDGQTIAFFASADAIGKTGFDRFYVPYKLYLMDAEQLDPQPVLEQIFFPHIIAWSPDSSHIAFIGDYGKLENSGLWLFSVETQEITGIAKGTFQDFVWMPDGKSVVALHADSEGKFTEIVQYDLSNLLD